MLSRPRHLQIQRVPLHLLVHRCTPSAGFACRTLKRCQPTTKQLLSEPHQISVDHVGLAVVGYLLDAALSVDPGDTGAVCSDIFRKTPHNATYLMKRRACLRVGRRENIAGIQRVFGIAIEVASGDQPRRDHVMHRCTMSQHRQIGTRAVRRDKLRLTLSPTSVSINSFFRPFADMRRTSRFHLPGTVDFFVITAPKQRIV
jgi:hypothetical protein